MNATRGILRSFYTIVFGRGSAPDLAGEQLATLPQTRSRLGRERGGRLPLLIPSSPHSPPLDAYSSSQRCRVVVFSHISVRMKAFRDSSGARSAGGRQFQVVGPLRVTRNTAPAAPADDG